MRVFAMPNMPRRKLSHAMHFKVVALVLLFFIVGCSGDSGSSTASLQPDDVDPTESENAEELSIQGLFASGRGIEGLVTIRGSGGNETQGFSLTDGSFEVDVRGLQPPYRVKGEAFDSEVVFYSFTNVAQYTNINQLTTAAVDLGLNGGDLETFFTGFSDDQLLPMEVLAASEDALKEGLLVQILGNGVNPTDLSLFRTRFIPNRLGYDAILEALDGSAMPLNDAQLNSDAARSMQRLLAKFYVQNDDGMLALNTNKLTRELFQAYFTTLQEELISQSVIKPITLTSGDIRYLATTEAGRNYAKSALLQIAMAQTVEIFGQVVGFDEADIIFLQELASIPFQVNLLTAMEAMYRGLQGQDTSLMTQPLLDALENSALGPDRRYETARAWNLFFMGNPIELISCQFGGDTVDEGRTQCRFRDRNKPVEEEYNIDFNTAEVIGVTEGPGRLEVQDIQPATGEVASVSFVRDPVVKIRWSGPIWRGGVSTDLDRQALVVQALRDESGQYVDCEDLQFIGDREVECRFSSGSFEFDQSYTLSVVVEAEQGGLVSHVLSRFRTPMFPEAQFSVEPGSGVYSKPVEVKVEYSGTAEVRYVAGQARIVFENSLPLSADQVLAFDANRTLAVAAFDGTTRVSPVVRRAYVVALDEIQEPEPAPETTMDSGIVPTGETQSGNAEEPEVLQTIENQYGNLAVPLRRPTRLTEDQKELRNSLQWYLANQDSQLYIAECQLRHSSVTSEGQPMNWASAVVALGRVGVSLEVTIVKSMLSCVGIMSRFESGVSFDQAIFDALCSTPRTSEDFDRVFADEYNFAAICPDSPINEAPLTEAPVGSGDNFTPNIPNAENESEPSIRNTLGWYIANPDSKLRSIECATRPMGGVSFPGTGGNYLPGIVVDTGTGIAVDPTSPGWNVISTALTNNGVGTHRNIHRSVLACDLVLTLVNLDAGISYSDAVEQTLETWIDVFE